MHCNECKEVITDKVMKAGDRVRVRSFKVIQSLVNFTTRAIMWIVSSAVYAWSSWNLGTTTQFTMIKFTARMILKLFMEIMILQALLMVCNNMMLWINALYNKIIWNSVRGVVFKWYILFSFYCWSIVDSCVNHKASM